MWQISLNMFLKQRVPPHQVAGKLWASLLSSSVYSPRLVTLASRDYERFWPTSFGQFPLPNELVVSEEYLPNSNLTHLKNEGLPNITELQSHIEAVLQLKGGFGLFVWGNSLINFPNYMDNSGYIDSWCFRDAGYNLLTPIIGVKITYPVPAIQGIFVSIQTLTPHPYFTFDDRNLEEPSEQMKAGRLNWQRFLSIMVNLQEAAREVSDQVDEIDLTIEGGGIAQYINPLANEAERVFGKIEK